MGKIPYTGMKVILKFADDTACALLHGRDKNAALLMQRAELSPLCHARPRAGKPPQRAREGGSEAARRGREAAGCSSAGRAAWALRDGSDELLNSASQHSASAPAKTAVAHQI